MNMDNPAPYNKVEHTNSCASATAPDTGDNITASSAESHAATQAYDCWDSTRVWPRFGNSASTWITWTRNYPEKELQSSKRLAFRIHAER